MNLWLRMLRVALPAWWGRRLGPREESVLRFRVWPGDLDANLHMNNGRYLTVADLGRVDLLIRTGVAGALRRNRWGGVVASVTVRYRRPLNLFQRYELRTRLLGWDERWVFMEQRFTRGGELVAHAVVKAQFLGPEGRVAPRRVGEAAGFDDVSSPPMSDAVAEWQGAEDRLVRGASNVGSV